MSLHSEQQINFQDRETPSHTELSSRRVYWGCILGSRHGADLGCHCSGEFEPLGGTFVWSTGFLFVRLYQGDKSENMFNWCRFFSSILRRFPWANADSHWLHELADTGITIHLNPKCKIQNEHWLHFQVFWISPLCWALHGERSGEPGAVEVVGLRVGGWAGASHLQIVAPALQNGQLVSNRSIA